jgi:Tfp pilus assembly protein FimT
MTELVIVVMVMGIMAAAAAPAFLNSLVHQRVEAAAHRLKTDLELTRQTARLTSTPQTIVFTNEMYTLPEAVKDLNDPNARYVVDLTAAPYEITTIAANFSNAQTATFNGYGLPSSGGTVVVTCNGHSSSVIVNAVTGEITINSTHTAPAAMDGN